MRKIRTLYIIYGYYHYQYHFCYYHCCHLYLYHHCCDFYYSHTHWSPSFVAYSLSLTRHSRSTADLDTCPSVRKKSRCQRVRPIPRAQNMFVAFSFSVKHSQCCVFLLSQGCMSFQVSVNLPHVYCGCKQYHPSYFLRRSHVLCH